MAYTMTESPVDYHASQKYIRYKGLRKGSTRSDYDAPVAPHDTSYSSMIQQNVSRYKDSQPRNYYEHVPLLATIQNPFDAAFEQQSFSVNQGDDARRMESTSYEIVNQAQHEALKRLNGEADQLQNVPKDGWNQGKPETQIMKDWHEEGVRWDPAEIYDEYAVQPQETETGPIEAPHGQVPKEKPVSYGLPSNPRPDPHRRHPSIDKFGTMDPHRRNASRAQHELSDSHRRDPSADRSAMPDTQQRNPSLERNDLPYSYRRDPSMDRNESLVPNHRNPSIDDRGIPSVPHRNPSIERSAILYPHSRNRSAERNAMPIAQEDILPSSLQGSYRFEKQADLHQRKPSYPERKGSSESQNGSADSGKGVYGSRKGSSTSQSEGSSQIPIRPSVSSTQSSSSRTPRSRSKTATRKVKVTCDQISFKLSFLPGTTAKDILSMARDHLGEGFDQKRYILVESYGQLGLERPLRHFERISDVLDTWDTDDADSLLIQPFHAQWEHESLDLENAPKLVPAKMTANLYYSHRPESWHKWTFTLRVDGQIVMQKYSGGDYKAICHMNDFDIYIPTSRQMKKLAPPRKFCFALKCQQKSSLFADASNYVHFFSTTDKDVASEWYRAVHSWRSHYITHSKEARQASPTPMSKPSYSTGLPQRNASLPGSSQLRKASTDKPLPKLDEALVSITNNDFKPFNSQGIPLIAHERAINPHHNRSVSADRYGGSQRNLSHGPVMFPGSLASKSSTEQARNVRRQHQAVKSDPLTIQTSFSRQMAENSLLERGYAMTKQSSEPAPFSARAVVHPYSYGKPSVDLTIGRKLSDGLNNGPYTAGVSAPPGWKFDPYTGQPLTTVLPIDLNGSEYAVGSQYSESGSTSRKPSYESTIDTVNEVSQEDHQVLYRNRHYNGSTSGIVHQATYTSNIQPERINEATTQMGESFF